MQKKATQFRSCPGRSFSTHLLMKGGGGGGGRSKVRCNPRRRPERLRRNKTSVGDSRQYSGQIALTHTRVATAPAHVTLSQPLKVKVGWEYRIILALIIEGIYRGLGGAGHCRYQTAFVSLSVPFAHICLATLDHKGRGRASKLLVLTCFTKPVHSGTLGAKYF